MVITCIIFVLFVSLVSRGVGDKCIVKTESGNTKRVCCADFEAKENDCVACSKGYTSKTGDICRPCPNSTYGDRCNHECSCSVFEICNIVEGCVKFLTIPTTAKIPIHETSVDSTTLQKDPAGSTNVKNINTSVDELLSAEILIIFALSAIVVVFGVCLCFILYKYKLSQNKMKRTVIRLPIPQIPQNNHPIEMDYRLYDIINDADVIDDHNLLQIQMSADYLDVISTGSAESSNMVNHGPSAQTKKHKLEIDNCSGNSYNITSSSDDDIQELTEGYLNPYQPMIKTSPLTKTEYLTLGTIHTTNSGVSVYKRSAINENESVTKDPEQMEEDGVRRLSENCNYPNRCLSNMRGYVSMSCVNVNIERSKMQICSGKERPDKKSTDKYNHDYYNLFKSKSESDIFSKHVQKNKCSHSFSKRLSSGYLI